MNGTEEAWTAEYRLKQNTATLTKSAQDKEQQSIRQHNKRNGISFRNNFLGKTSMRSC